jgi:hypothetical protein
MPGMLLKHRWAEGIRIVTCDGKSPDPYVVINDEEGVIVATVDEYGIMSSFPDADSTYPFVPDLTDPATLGCLLSLVRDAYRDAYVSASSLHDENGYWGVRDCDGFVIATGRSEREALVIALEKLGAT